MKFRFVIYSIILFIGVSFSQEIDFVEVKKLELNTTLSEISSDVNQGKLYLFRNKIFYNRLSQYYDLYSIKESEVNGKKSFNNLESLSLKLKGVSHYHEGPAFVDEINNKIYLTINTYNKEEFKEMKKEAGTEVNKLRIVEADFINGEIVNLKEFPFSNPEYSMGHASFSHITQRLYFASTRRGGKGSSDIYYSQKLKDGSWLEPVNLGRRINTEGDEIFPYAKDTILFFSSNRHKEDASKDIDIFYISEYEILSSEPTRLPSNINSSFDDFALCFKDSSNKYIGYFTSNRNNIFPSDDDIYSFRMDALLVKRKYVYVSEFISKFGDPIDSAKIKLIDVSGKVIKDSYTDKEGKVSFYGLDKGAEYKVKFTKDTVERKFDVIKNYTLDIAEESFQLDLPNELATVANQDIGVFSFKREADTVDDENMQIVRNAKERTVDIRIKNIHFALNSAEIFPYSARKIDFIVNYFNAISAKYVYLEAHTDSRSSNQYNLALSEKRAKACKDYLVKKGIPDSKIRYKGMGETKLLNKCVDGVDCPDSMHLENRRVEFKMGY
jgi:outer membrane protein OmpA-like peptidoglycan-associated protein